MQPLKKPDKHCHCQPGFWAWRFRVQGAKRLTFDVWPRLLDSVFKRQKPQNLNFKTLRSPMSQKPRGDWTLDTPLKAYLEAQLYLISRCHNEEIQGCDIA